MDCDILHEAHLFDDEYCSLGEGPLWHPEANFLLWFDINRKSMHIRKPDGPRVSHQFSECVSAAGWISQTELLIASEQALFAYDIQTRNRHDLVALEADNLETRSNDGRADPMGGFWIGTMGKKAQTGAGGIYRYYRGELRQLFGNITIPNSICFSPDGSRAYFTDTVAAKIMEQRLDPLGWPLGAPSVLIDLTDPRYNPDGSVVDADGNIWNAQWGAGRVACYSPTGGFIGAVRTPVSQASCPAFGGDALKTLFITSAREKLSDDALAREPQAGATYAIDLPVKGQAEHRVIL